MTQYMPIEELFAVPHQWERHTEVPLSEMIAETRRRLLTALDENDRKVQRYRSERRAA